MEATNKSGKVKFTLEEEHGRETKARSRHGHDDAWPRINAQSTKENRC